MGQFAANSGGWCGDMKRGASMGRYTERPPDGGAPKGKVRLFQVRLDSGGYDDGGAYWGTGAPLFRLLGEDVDLYTRAKDRAAAVEHFKREFPGLTLVRPC